ncbi:MAG: SDR family NAD(P)-dependent oxidoreductase [Thermoanaerobaculia bacterium]
MELKNRVVLVTGAGRGIGRALALAFAHRGAHVALMGKTKKNLQEVQKELKPFDVKTAVLAGDVSEEGVVARCVSAAEQQLGPIDVLVNNAGVFAAGPIDRLDTVVFDRILAVNLRGPFLMARFVLPGMKNRRFGHIVNISSTAGKRGFSGGGAYCASKFGLAGLSEAMLYEARPFDVRVSCIFPSTVNTDLVAKAGILTKDPGKAIQPEDVAEAVVSLVSLEGRAMVTGLEMWQTNP